ncbi:MAG: hypothetical protein IJS68_02820 [Clostridia bacterium]|nr:hypothetical protein [Clostridia bacterium]
MMEHNKANNVKQRISATILCALILIFSCFYLSACGQTNATQPSALNMEYYTASRSTYQLIYPNDEYTTDSLDFVGQEQISRAYSKITVKLSSEWLYLFHADRLEFKITTNHDCVDIAENNTSLQIDTYITNLHNGTTNGSIAAKSLKTTVICEQSAGKTKTYSIAVDDYFEKSAEITCILFSLSNPEIYATYPDFTFSISGVTLYGKHQYI